MWAVNSSDDKLIKRHFRDCELHITCPQKLGRIYKEFLKELPSKVTKYLFLLGVYNYSMWKQYYLSGVFLITTLLSKNICVPNEEDIDRFIDAAIENDRCVIVSCGTQFHFKLTLLARLTLAASMLRSIRHLKERFVVEFDFEDNFNVDHAVSPEKEEF